MLISSTSLAIEKVELRIELYLESILKNSTQSNNNIQRLVITAQILSKIKSCLSLINECNDLVQNLKKINHE